MEAARRKHQCLTQRSDTKKWNTDKDCKVNRQYRLARKESEKIRRDKLKMYIMELACMVPSVVTAKKRLDKVNILRLTVNYLRIHYDLRALQSATRHWKPDFLDHDTLHSLIGEATGGFLLIVDNNGIIVFASDATVTYLGFNVIDLLNESITEILHPSDREEFNSQFVVQSDDDCRDGGHASSNRPAETHQRSFYVRLRNNVAGFSDSYSTVHINGQLKMVTQPTRTESDGAADHALSADRYLLAVCRLVNEQELTTPTPYSVTETEQWASRHGVMGQIWDADARLSLILGFLPSEVMKINAYDFVPEEDIPYMKYIHVQMVGKFSAMTRCFHRCFTKTSEVVYLCTDSVLVADTWTKKPKYITAVHYTVAEAIALEQLKKQTELLLLEEARGGLASNAWDPEVYNGQSTTLNAKSTSAKENLPGATKTKKSFSTLNSRSSGRDCVANEGCRVDSAQQSPVTICTDENAADPKLRCSSRNDILNAVQNNRERVTPLLEHNLCSPQPSDIANTDREHDFTLQSSLTHDSAISSSPGRNSGDPDADDFLSSSAANEVAESCAVHRKFVDLGSPEITLCETPSPTVALPVDEEPSPDRHLEARAVVDELKTRPQKEGGMVIETVSKRACINLDDSKWKVDFGWDSVSDALSFRDSDSCESEGDVADVSDVVGLDLQQARSDSLGWSGGDIAENSDDEVQPSFSGSKGPRVVNRRCIVRNPKDTGLSKKAELANRELNLQLMQARLAQQLKEKQAFLERSINKQEKELKFLRYNFDKHEDLSTDPAFATHLQLICKLEDKRQKQKQVLVQLQKEYDTQTACMSTVARLGSDTGSFKSPPSSGASTSTISWPPWRTSERAATTSEKICSSSLSSPTESLSARAGLDVRKENFKSFKYTRCSQTPGSVPRAKSPTGSVTNTGQEMPNQSASLLYKSYVNQAETSRGQHCSNHQGEEMNGETTPSLSSSLSADCPYEARYFGDMFLGSGQSHESGQARGDTSVITYHHNIPMTLPGSENTTDLTPPLPVSPLYKYLPISQTSPPSLQCYSAGSSPGIPDNEEQQQPRLASYALDLARQFPLHSHAILPTFVNLTPLSSQLASVTQPPNIYGALTETPLTQHAHHQTNSVAGVRKNLYSLALKRDSFEDMTATIPALEPTQSAMAMVADSLIGLDSDDFGQYMGPGCTFMADMASTARKEVSLGQMTNPSESLFWRDQNGQPSMSCTQTTSVEHSLEQVTMTPHHSHHQGQNKMTLQEPAPLPNYWML